MEGTEEIERSIPSLLRGQQARVCSVGGRGALRQRLLDMGLIPGVTVELERVAPMGSPFWVKVRGVHLSLRREEAGVVGVRSS